MVNWTRKKIQVIFTLLTNLNIKGFFTGTIYTGQLKKICVPGLNCYSCPGALGSCPIGALQNVLANYKYKFSFYIVGFLMLVGTLVGRLACGYLCPFGLIQELLYKIKSRKLTLPRWTVFVKYFVLSVFVLLMPLFLTNKFGLGAPYFCKWICPAGTLEAGIPLILTNDFLKEMLGLLFTWKVLLLIVTIVASIIIFRPFCKVVCPLGAIYSLFNKISIYRLNFDEIKCINCNLCEAKCKMDISPRYQVNDIECIRCNECVEVCPTHAITTIKTMGDVYENKKIY